jgi:hypothetical protein
LPKLPNFNNNSLDLPRLEEIPRPKEISQLPSFPSDRLSEKFSQNTIKHAITGQKKGDEGGRYVEEYEESLPMTHEPLEQHISKPQKSKEVKTREVEPLFIRIDKFEESLKIFEKTQEQIKELGQLLEDTIELKTIESQELSTWETELQELKSKIDKVDKDLLISLCSDSIIKSVSAVGESELINTSNNELSSDNNTPVNAHFPFCVFLILSLMSVFIILSFD